MYIYTHTYTYICVYIYIYIYVERERDFLGTPVNLLSSSQKRQGAPPGARPRAENSKKALLKTIRQ